jgi:hypothetical protein
LFVMDCCTPREGVLMRGVTVSFPSSRDVSSNVSVGIANARTHGFVGTVSLALFVRSESVSPHAFLVELSSALAGDGSRYICGPCR